jgi:hypothetical protein
MFPHDEELAHVALDLAAVPVRVSVDKGEAGRLVIHADQQDVMARLAPVGIHPRQVAEAALFAQLEVDRARRLHL